MTGFEYFVRIINETFFYEWEEREGIIKLKKLCDVI